MACAPCASAASPSPPIQAPAQAARADGAADGAACDICTLRVLHFCSAEQKKSQSGKRHVVHRASPHHCHFCARCSAPFTRAHAASTRMQSTLVTHAPRVRASPAMHTHHAATRAQKLGCRARVTGHWLPVGRLAAGTSGANALYKHARHLRCAPPSIPCARSMLSISNALRKTRPLPTPDGHGRPSLLTPLLFSDARLLLARRVVGGGSGAAFVALCLRVLAN